MVRLWQTKLDSFNSYHHRSYSLNLVSSVMFFRPTFNNEIINIINQLDLRKKCKSDGISAKFGILAAYTIAPYLTISCNGCLSFVLFPSSLKTEKVIPIFKSGDKNNLLKHRPISLLPIFSRIVEKNCFPEQLTTKILTLTQYGFQFNYFTTHAVLDIDLTCYENIESKNYSAFVLVDLAKSFDTVNHKILLNMFENYDMRGVVNQFFLSFLSHRTQYVSFNNCSSSLAYIEVSIPQGSALGPLLFLLDKNDLPNSIICTPRLFAVILVY